MKKPQRNQKISLGLWGLLLERVAFRGERSCLGLGDEPRDGITVAFGAVGHEPVFPKALANVGGLPDLLGHRLQASEATLSALGGAHADADVRKSSAESHDIRDRPCNDGIVDTSVDDQLSQIAFGPAMLGELRGAGGRGVERCRCCEALLLPSVEPSQ